jgi:aldose 1-epimerase
VLRSGAASATIDPDDGCRVTSLTVDGVELLGLDDDTPGAASSPFHHGLFPMAPFAGRIRHGRFRFAGVDHQVPVNLGAHAIHGTVCDRAWSPVPGAPATWTCPLGERWPFPGHAVQRADLREDGLRLELEVHADDPDRPMPVTAGWHPWWRRVLLTPAGPSGGAEVDVAASVQYRKDDEGIPDGTVHPPTPGPYDDCFTGLARPPRIAWAGFGDVELVSSADHLVLYTEPRTAVCVEPQTGPPDAVNLGRAAVVAAGGPLVVTLDVRWRREPSGSGGSAR